MPGIKKREERKAARRAERIAARKERKIAEKRVEREAAGVEAPPIEEWPAPEPPEKIALEEIPEELPPSEEKIFEGIKKELVRREIKRAELEEKRIEAEKIAEKREKRARRRAYITLAIFFGIVVLFAVIINFSETFGGAPALNCSNYSALSPWQAGKCALYDLSDRLTGYKTIVGAEIPTGLSYFASFSFIKNLVFLALINLFLFIFARIRYKRNVEYAKEKRLLKAFFFKPKTIIFNLLYLILSALPFFNVVLYFITLEFLFVFKGTNWIWSAILRAIIIASVFQAWPWYKKFREERAEYKRHIKEYAIEEAQKIAID